MPKVARHALHLRRALPLPVLAPADGTAAAGEAGRGGGDLGGSVHVRVSSVGTLYGHSTDMPRGFILRFPEKIRTLSVCQTP